MSVLAYVVGTVLGIVLVGILIDVWMTIRAMPSYPKIGQNVSGIPPGSCKGVENVRDVGCRKITTESGKVMKRGILFRTARLSKMSESSRKWFESRSIRMIADFRSDQEIEKAPDKLGPVLSRRWQHFNVSNGDPTELIKQVLKSREKNKIAKLERFMEELYEDFALGANRNNFGRFINCIADGGHSPLIVHCTAGKDRTGWAVSLILRILGASEEDIMQDYLLSKSGFQSRARKYAVITRVASCFRVGRCDLEPLLSVRRNYMQHAYRCVLGRYGSWDRYFRDGIGVHDSAREKLKRIFLE